MKNAAAVPSRGQVLPWLVIPAAALAPGLMLLGAGVDGWRLFVVVLLAPVLEETVFRAGIQAELVSLLRSTHGANAATSTLFVIAHGWVAGSAHGLAVLLPSLLLGECWRRGRRLAPCMALHAAMNAAWLLGLDAAWAGCQDALMKTFATG